VKRFTIYSEIAGPAGGPIAPTKSTANWASSHRPEVDRSSDDVRVSYLEPRSIRKRCGNRQADIRPAPERMVTPARKAIIFLDLSIPIPGSRRNPL
jgi:hypothetical protein